MPSQKVTVQKDFDVIVARSRVRDLARSIGMSTTDQARISLATSSAARAMGLGAQYEGEILSECLNGHDCAGIRVTCRAKGRAEDDLMQNLGDAKFMTDELTIERSPTNDVVVTMVKWTKHGAEHDIDRGSG
jgi:anti-sigma regulatory factor (Ser/Thr protein kinase)